MKIALQTLAVVGFALVASSLNAAEWHVSLQGADANPGTLASPFRTIQHAAEQTQPGDVVTVHAGVYRERVCPSRGGLSDTQRIVYQAAPGETVEIKGSERITGWVRVQDDVWKVSLPNRFFGAFNPYGDLIRGDWFTPKGRPHHTGAVYLNGEWLTEASAQEEVFGLTGDSPLWFAEVDGERTTIWAQFAGVDPNEQQVEINVRQTVFYPDRPGINYLTVRGFALRQAATPWAPPTAEQMGLIGTHWSKGWIIENNVISHSVCSGIALGKYGDEWDNRSAESAEGYVGTIERALKNGWNQETVGHHVVRNNTISHCEQTGIVGSLGAIFSTITGNTIHDIHIRRLFTGAEMAGIKLHGAIDVEVRGNHIYRTDRGVWLDWMAQGARVSDNLMHDNTQQDFFAEVDHGPFVVDNNLLLSSQSLRDVSHGSAYVHNLIAGELVLIEYDNRLTPFHKAHSTELAGLHDNPSGDNRVYNNLVVGQGDLSGYDDARLPMWMEGNVYTGEAKASRHETAPLRTPADPAVRLVEAAEGICLELTVDPAWSRGPARKLVTSELLGNAAIPQLPYECRDGSPLRLDRDYLGQLRPAANPMAGPFEFSSTGPQRLKVWPRPSSD